MPKFSRCMNSIFARLFISFMIVITPIIIAGVIMSTWGKQTVKTQIVNSASANVSFLKNNLESEVKNIKMLQYNLVNDNSLQSLVNEYPHLSKYDYYMLISDVQQRLDVMKNSNTFISDVVVYMPGMHYSISANEGYKDLNTGDYNNLLKSYVGNKNPIVDDGSKMYAVTSFPFNAVNSSVKPLYLIEVDISRDRIQGYLAKFSNTDSGNTAMFEHATKSWVFSSQNQSQEKDILGLKAVINSTLQNKNTVAEIGNQKYYVISDFSNYLNFTFMQYVPMADMFRISDMYGYFLYVFSILAVIVFIFYSMYTYKFVKYPVNTILSAFRRVEKGDLSIRVKIKAANEFNDLIEGFNMMVVQLDELIDKMYKQEIYSQRMELKQLQSQINPHFLYNSFFMLDRMIKEKDFENANMLSSHLGKYFQYITRNSSDEVALKSEVEHARSYAKIQEMRFSTRMSVQMEQLPEKFADLQVPRLILQPVLENCLEHGLNNTLKNGIIKICFSEITSGLSITVEDSGSGLDERSLDELKCRLSGQESINETTGLINVHKRLRLSFGENSGIFVSRSEIGGLKVEIRILTEGKSKNV